MRRLSEEERKRIKEMVDLRKLVDFGVTTCAEDGELTKSREIMPGCLHMVRELRNQVDLTFLHAVNEGRIGWNVLKIWYHPGKRFHPTMPMSLSVVWSVKDPSVVTVRVMDADRAWAAAVRKLLTARNARMANLEPDTVIQSSTKGILGRRVHRLA